MYKPKRLLFLDIPKLKEIAKKPGTCGLRARHKLDILTRDGFKCVSCGRSDRLTVAHIVPLRGRKDSQGRNASSYKLDECKTQCVDCHLKEEFGR